MKAKLPWSSQQPSAGHKPQDSRRSLLPQAPSPQTTPFYPLLPSIFLALSSPKTSTILQSGELIPSLQKSPSVPGQTGKFAWGSHLFPTLPRSPLAQATVSGPGHPQPLAHPP